MSESTDAESADSASRARATIARLREVLARGATLKQAGREVPELGGSQWRAYRLAVKHNLPRRRRSLPRDKVRLIEKELRRARLTLNALARLAKVSPMTVWRKKIARDGPGPRPSRPYWCRGCGKRVNLRPCQICRALRGRDPDDGAKGI